MVDYKWTISVPIGDLSVPIGDLSVPLRGTANR
jgi:hypothetical protein